MIVKFEKIINCSSEHPMYPAANLLQSNAEKWKAAWRCAKPGEMLAYVIFRLKEPSYISGIDIGNYQSCVVIVTGSTLSEPDNWMVIVNHKFMTNDEAANNKFKDQVQLFTRRELNPDILKIKFDRVKVTCMQSANLKVLFGLSFIIVRSDNIVDLGLEILGKYKLKQSLAMKTPMDTMREKMLKNIGIQKTNYREELHEQIKRNAMENLFTRQQERRPMKRPLLEKLEAGKADEVFGKKNKSVKDTATLQSAKDKVKISNKSPGNNIKNASNNGADIKMSSKDTVSLLNVNIDIDNINVKNPAQNQSDIREHPLSNLENCSNVKLNEKKQCCSERCKDMEDSPCKTCQRLPELGIIEDSTMETRNNVSVKRKKAFQELLDDVVFSLSGYLNPQRDEIRKKALNMGARYIPNPNTTDKKCTHLICAFKNTPKYQQFKNHTRIVSHAFIEECFDKKTRFPWRRFALDQTDKSKPESEEEIDAQPVCVYDVDTDSDSND